MGEGAGMMQFLHMGGYAIYVWPSYILVLTILLLNANHARRRFKRTLRDVLQEKQD